ncbi:hypothetical protein [Vallitalea maricola]|uniref:Uncharacterized protein n=1 Tax=Vallitalea maricola TaxID=3074433 RepID=A0ACB5UF36_9FIRM|nr:hypothetical protein AN2V17_04010 [Vallitalea sp. AN17-2]
MRYKKRKNKDKEILNIMLDAILHNLNLLQIELYNQCDCEGETDSPYCKECASYEDCNKNTVIRKKLESLKESI